jgi:menaquinone-dependent protoporphyrinogen oxidase
MNGKILVSYASKYGATQEIAEKIGGTLQKAGLQVDVKPVASVQGLDQYQATILGSAIYIGKWQKEAVVFLQTNEKTLAGRPFWLFSSGPTGTGDPVELLDGLRVPVALQPVVDRIHPSDITVFHGFINPEKLNFMEKFAIKNIVKKPMGDFRDWDAIVAWANTVADALKGVEQPQ